MNQKVSQYVWNIGKLFIFCFTVNNEFATKCQKSVAIGHAFYYL